MDIFSALAAAVNKQNCDELLDAVNMVNQDFEVAPLLAQILLEDWHDSHEDIVLELGLIGNPTVVDAIASAAKTKFLALVEWGNLHEFQTRAKIGQKQTVKLT